MKDNVKHDPTSPMYHIHLSDYLLSKQSSKKKGSRRGYDYNNTSLAYGNERFIKMKTTCAKTQFMSVLFIHQRRDFLFTHQFNLKTLLCLQTYTFVLSTSYEWVTQCGMWR